MSDREKDREEVIKHLEMIQVIINRLGRDSFLIKGWSTVIPSVIVLFAIRYDMPFGYNVFLLIFLLIFPVIFWRLDAYYLWKERLFRGLYDEVRKQSNTDFDMQWSQGVERKNSWRDVLWSRTLRSFYIAQVVFIVLIFCFQWIGGNYEKCIF